MQWDMDVLPHDGELLRREAAAMPQDQAFPTFVRTAQRRGAQVEVVSDGLGFYVASNLAALGLGDVGVATNENRVEGGGAGMSFPFGHPSCFVCGTCKRQRVLAHRAAGRRVVFIGDGESDRYAAGYSDIVFAKRSLERICIEAGWEFRRWTAIAEVDGWLAETLAAWAADPSSIAALPANAPPPRGYFCGPEVWGEGLEDPPPGSWPPA